MNAFLKQLIILIIGNILISTVYCDETMELTCTTDEDCKSFENKFIYSQCADDACICQNRKDSTWADCSPTVESVENEDVKATKCKAPNTEFRIGMCRTKVVQLGKACEENLQCNRNEWNSECINEVCVCKNHYMEVEHACRPIIQSDKCTKDEQCPEHAECFESKCICNKGFINSLDHKTCLPFRAYNETCEETDQCFMKYSHGATCKKGICSCMSNYAVTEKEGAISCRRTAFVGDTCFDHNDCFSDKIQLYCNNYICTCSESPEKNVASCKKPVNKDGPHASPLTSGAASIKVFNTLFVIFFAILIVL
ncbi:unnamed protein product [Chironomus riparius]|uniref:EB domain-containing protein n=1 Tax=Chironomus riparius TaxID=315576 RepID=A0A9N9S0T9_9DIPT|nr:unnamed protein product [Chironomus riparius]